MSIDYHAVLYIVNELNSIEDIAYSQKSENIIALRIDIDKACKILSIKAKKITLRQAKKIAMFLDMQELRS